MRDAIGRGQAYPLGATVRPGGVNFSVFSKNCDRIELLLFDEPAAARPSRVIPLDPERNRTFYYWHVFVPGLTAGQLYGYRAHGPQAPERGHRFDGEKLLIDPYARAVAGMETYERAAAISPGDNAGKALKSVVVDLDRYNWEGDTPLNRPFAGSVIYELHVGGFTRHPSSGVRPERRGTFAGLIEKIPYLVELGVTAVELLPVQQFCEQDVRPPLRNYWGYSPIAYFAPHQGYCSRRGPGEGVDEFRDLVKALHRAGIEVILDVVFNHTGEGPAEGPTLSFRGLENRAYYLLEPGGRYANYTGCGNTLNANHSIVRRLIVDCLRYWVERMHVDGFRFDLASVLSRGEEGEPLPAPPILWEIESDPVLAGTKIIAEAWDAAGLYQVGSFIGHRWAEWNGLFRDDVRRFVRGDRGTVARLAQRLSGSPDVFGFLDGDTARDPHRAINFVTCHDGFTLCDLVSYNAKHNEANGEGNRDGSDQNDSWNCGVEGPTADPEIVRLRERQARNLLVALLVAQGTPLLLMGDEILRTQGGNNNAYCQDNEIGWMDWRGLSASAGMHRFVRELLRLRRQLAIFREERFWTDGGAGDGARVRWHGVRVGAPDLAEDSHTLAFTLEGAGGAERLHVMLNAYWEPLEFELPSPAPGAPWRLVVDTGRPAPFDIVPLEEAEEVRAGSLRLLPRSAVVLVAGGHEP